VRDSSSTWIWRSNGPRRWTTIGHLRYVPYTVGGIHGRYTLQGTIPFLALSRHSESVPHRPRHDLESFFWAWVWCLLRHAPRLTFNESPIKTSAQRLDALNSVFNYKSRLFKAFIAKHDLVVGTTLLTSDVNPLSDAILVTAFRLNDGSHAMDDAYRYLRLNTARTKAAPQGREWEDLKAKAISSVPNHRTLFEVFNEYLLQHEWPGDDAAVPFHGGVISSPKSASAATSSAGSSARKLPRSHQISRKRPRDPFDDQPTPFSPKKPRSV
jgi:hypothetical protein